ncbi:hypothetical protein ACHAXS_009411, partial [Conticribra weissflogii]
FTPAQGKPLAKYVYGEPASGNFNYSMHYQALKQINCYLKATSDKGLVMKPSEKFLKIDCFPYVKNCWDSWAWCNG